MTEPGVITVVVGSLDPLLDRGLADVLSQDRYLRVLERGLDWPELQRMILHEAPKVAILGEEALSAGLLPRIRAAQPRTGLLILAHAPTHADGTRLLASGASCLARTASIEDLLQAVHLTANGGRLFISPDGGRVERRYPMVGRSLTKRETEVAEQLSEGRSNAEIARALQISVETARTHVAAILRKYGVRSRRKLIGLAIPSPPDA